MPVGVNCAAAAGAWAKLADGCGARERRAKPGTAAGLCTQFKSAKPDRVGELLATLGKVRSVDGERFVS